MFSACLSRCERISQADSGRNRTRDPLILDRRHTTRSQRKPDGYGWFDSHNSSRYCVDLSIKGEASPIICADWVSGG